MERRKRAALTQARGLVRRSLQVGHAASVGGGL